MSWIPANGTGSSATRSSSPSPPTSGARSSSVGRATAVWSRAQRRAITTRSPHCQWPGGQTIAPWCDIHHFHHWEHGGTTSLENGVHLCRRHHVFLHQHRDRHATFDHRHFRVYRADGTEVHPDAWHHIAA